MPKKKRQTKISMLWDGENILLTELCVKLKITYQCLYSSIKDGYDTQEKLLKFREEIKAGKRKTGGGDYHKPTLHKTIKGKLSYSQMEEAHEHGISDQTLRQRCLMWGSDHACIWYPTMGRTAFHAKAIAEDGPPRGVLSKKKDAKTPPKAKHRSIKKVALNRTKTCYRGKDRLRCIHYEKRLKMAFGVPDECKKAFGDTCENYQGENLDTSE